MSASRIRSSQFAQKVVSAEEAVKFIKPGDTIGLSGFTGAGYPKAVPGALAEVIKAAQARGEEFKVGLLTGASTAPEADGVLADVNGVSFRTPFQSDPSIRKRINAGDTEYQDVHLSHLAPGVASGVYGKVDIAVIEISAINEDGSLVPSSSVGNNNTWLDLAERVILEVNSWQPEQLHGMHDIYSVGLPPHRQPIPLSAPGDRIGSKYLTVDPAKVVAVIETDQEDRNSAFSPPDEVSQKISQNVLDFLLSEVKVGRLPKELLPLQSGVGNVANAVLAGLNEGPFEGLTSFTEVIQDGMLDLLDSGKLELASATAFSLSPDAIKRLNENIDFYSQKIILRPQDVSNHPELIRRLGVVAMNSLIEADIYGNVNSTNIMGSKIQNGIGGSGDFARNSFISIFVTPSIAKNGDISAIVPFVSHVDHTEHDVQVIATEYGLADLRGLSPKARAEKVIAIAHPDYRAELQDYYDRALKESFGGQTPHIIDESLSWHDRFIKTGSMKKK